MALAEVSESARASNDAERRHALWVLLARDAEIPDLPTARPSWHASARCHGQQDVMFSNRPGDIAKARALCDDCPAKVRCATEAVERDEKFGVWGGTTPADRLAFKRSARR